MNKSVVEFEEPLLYYNEELNLWQEKSELQIHIQSLDSLKSDFPESILVQTIRSTSALSKSDFRQSGIQSTQTIIVSYDYEFHYYPRSNFIHEKNIKGHPVLGSINMPLHIIALSRKKLDENGDDVLYLDAIGCDCICQTTKEKISMTLARLYSEVRYSELSLITQVKERLINIVGKCLKDIIRFLATATVANTHKSLSTAEYFYSLLKIDLKQLPSNPDLGPELENIVYKCIISEGLFPFFCEINTMNTNVFKLALVSLIMPDSIVPWSPKFHASFGIGDFHYSFTPNNRMNTRKIKDRKFTPDFFYVRIKILDFFPLDEWIKSIARYLLNNLWDIFRKVKALNPDVFEDVDESLEIKKHSTFPLEGEADKLRNTTDNLHEEIYKERRHGTSFEKHPGFQPIILSEKVSFSQNRQKALQEPLLKESGRLNFFHKILSKKKSSDPKPSENEEKVKTLKAFLKKWDLMESFPDLECILTNVAVQFFENYKFELKKTDILWNISKIIARTELRQYELLSNNCQTPVAESLHIIHEKLKQFIEPLQEKKDFKLTCKKVQTEYFKFSSRVTKIMNEQKILKPMVLDCNLDYFGIYADKYLQKYLENLKKITVFENFQKVNVKIGFSEKKIMALFENFGKKYQTVFTTFKGNSFLSNQHTSEQTIPKSSNWIEERKEWSCVEERKEWSCRGKLDETSNFNNEKTDPPCIKKSNTESFFNSCKVEIHKLDSFHFKKQDSQKKSHKKEKINRALSYIVFMCENLILNYKIRLSLCRKPEEKPELILKKYEMISLFREFSYYYFNSVRLKNAAKLNKNNISYIGFLLVKDPGKVLTEMPENGKEIYASAYM